MINKETRELAKKYAKMLGEKTESPLRQLCLLLEHMGEDAVRENVEKAIEIDAGEGMMTADGSRRRTTGGIFFYIIKMDMDTTIRQRVFPNYGQQIKGRVLEWADRTSHMPDLFEEPGSMRYNRILIHGYPGKVQIMENTVMTTITHRHETNSPYPRGVPVPPDLETRYTVYISMKHWEPVAESLEKNPHDPLIIEGDIMYDPELESIAVFATSVTTKMIEKNYRRLARAGEAPPSANKKPLKKKKKKKDDTKPRQNHRQAQPESAPVPATAVAAPVPVEDPGFDMPEGVSSEVADKLRQLFNAKETLRQRIDDKASKGQRTSLEEKLLENTQRQFDTLMAEHQ